MDWGGCEKTDPARTFKRVRTGNGFSHPPLYVLTGWANPVNVIKGKQRDPVYEKKE